MSKRGICIDLLCAIGDTNWGQMGYSIGHGASGIGLEAKGVRHKV